MAHYHKFFLYICHLLSLSSVIYFTTDWVLLFYIGQCMNFAYFMFFLSLFNLWNLFIEYTLSYHWCGFDYLSMIIVASFMEPHFGCINGSKHCCECAQVFQIIILYILCILHMSLSLYIKLRVGSS